MMVTTVAADNRQNAVGDTVVEGSLSFEEEEQDGMLDTDRQLSEVRGSNSHALPPKRLLAHSEHLLIHFEISPPHVGGFHSKHMY